MKILKVLTILLIAGGLWSTSLLITELRLKALEKSGIIPYGPIPAQESFGYSYQGMRAAFDPRVPIKRAEEFSKEEFEAMIMASFTPKAQEALKPYLKSALNYSVDYQVDPFWILSIIMVESNFKLTATSPKNARGLMQIKPDTAQHLYQLMQKNLTEDEVSQNLYHPEENMDVGVFYLKKLLQNFRMNYRFATVAYNIGPSKLRNRLGENSLDVDNFSYLVKVKDRYQMISQNFLAQARKKPLPFEMTYVVLNQGLKLEEKIVSLYLGSTSENLVALNQKL
jgi:Transglycosylase SLT domain